MRFGISPTEKNELESAYRVASNNFMEGVERDLPPLSLEERSEEHAHRGFTKKRKFGRMSTRDKPAFS